MERQDSAPRPSSRKGIKRFSGERLRHAATLGDIGALRAELADKASARNLQKALDEGLKLAAQHGRVEAALYLIDCGADVAIERGAPFAMAIWRGELEVAAALMERGVDVADCGQVHWLLLAAVNQNDLELAQLLLEKGVEPGHPNLLPLRSAIGARRREIALLLAERCANRLGELTAPERQALEKFQQETSLSPLIARRGQALR